MRVYITSNWVGGIIGAAFMLFLWMASLLWQFQNERTNLTNQQMTEKITDIAKSSESTAKSMHDLVVFVKEDRVEINALRERVKSLEGWQVEHERLTTDFFRDYDLHKRK